MAVRGSKKPKSTQAGSVRKPNDFTLHPLLLRDYWDRRISAGDLAMVVNDKRWCVVWQRKRERE